MANKATVITKRQLVGVEFDVASFQQATTPEVFVPDSFTDITANSVTAPTGDFTNLSVGNLSIDTIDANKITGIGATELSEKSLDDLTNVETGSPTDLSILQYDYASQKWYARSSDEFIDGVIDGGFADTIHQIGLDIDGGVP